ncbi:MAG: phenylacetate--CoA ligase family protein [Lachnospiraceae bacterium]|nr:phenylacetate--CoA ligase family protein [Lachnospiraceae bacterium]
MNLSDKEFIKRAYSSVPMYVELTGDLDINLDSITEIKELPTITKEEVVKQDSIIAADSIPLLYGNKLIVKKTSGSTGKYMDVFWKNKDYVKSMLPLWLMRKRMYNISPDDRMCFFYTMMEMGKEQDTYMNKSQLGFSKSRLDDENLHRVYKKMKEFEPKWLLLQPSIGALLCEYMDKYNEKAIESIEYIEMSGEILSESVRAEIERHFRCNVVNQYGANEFNSIAYECPNGNMHIMESNVIVEVLKDGKGVEDGTEGEVYISTRTNSAMPLIRYKIGDIGKICTGKCDCGCDWKMFELTSGRVSDYILCEDGSTVTSYALVRAIESVNYIYENVIRQFRIIQNDIDDFNIILVVDEEDLDMCDVIESAFKESIMEERLIGAAYTFEYGIELIPNDENGKFAYFKRLVR